MRIAAGIENVDGVATLSGLGGLFQNLVGALLGGAGIVLFIMIMVAGFKYMTSGGDPKNVESAKNTFTYAIIGLVVIASSVLIIRTIEYFTGATLSTFLVRVPGP